MAAERRAYFVQSESTFRFINRKNSNATARNPGITATQNTAWKLLANSHINAMARAGPRKARGYLAIAAVQSWLRTAAQGNIGHQGIPRSPPDAFPNAINEAGAHQAAYIRCKREMGVW